MLVGALAAGPTAKLAWPTEWADFELVFTNWPLSPFAPARWCHLESLSSHKKPVTKVMAQMPYPGQEIISTAVRRGCPPIRLQAGQESRFAEMNGPCVSYSLTLSTGEQKESN